MKKSIWIPLIVIGVLLIGVGVWWWFGVIVQKGSTTPADLSGTAERADLTHQKEVALKIRDLSFIPANIKIKKGTVVTWTNQDTMGHAVVADVVSNPGGLPVEIKPFGRGQTARVTFKELGTFRYHCGVHSFMHGSIEVVE